MHSMNFSWGVDLWDGLDNVINYSTNSSNLIDKSYKCFSECNNVWQKAAQKQKRLLDRLQTEIKESALDEFTLAASLLSIVNNLISICNIESTFQDSVAKASENYFKKSHSEIKKQTTTWSSDKRKIDEDLAKERKKYDIALKRYREKYLAMMGADDNLKKSQDNKTLSKSQVDLCQNSLYTKRDEFEESQRDYAAELENFNKFQHKYYSCTLVNWGKEGEKLYDQRITLLNNMSHELVKFTKEMIKNLSYSINRFTDIGEALSFEKDAVKLVNKYKTGDVPPGDLQFLHLDSKINTKKPAQNIYDNPKDFDDPNTSRSSSSSFSSSISPRKDIVNSGSYSSTQLSMNAKSEPDRPSVQNVKMRNTGKMINPEAGFSFRKSKKIFKSTIPWKENSISDKPTTDKQKPHYQRRGRSTYKEGHLQQRSQSVTDMISSVWRSSFKKKSHSPAETNRTPIQHDSSDFDTDSSYEKCNTGYNQPTLEIVSTPAEAVSLTQRKNSLPDYSTVDSDYAPMFKAQDQNDAPTDDNYEYTYVGSCKGSHDFDANDPTNEYLTFKRGDKFFIIKMDEGTGWMFVERADQVIRGFVPTSYMEIQQYEKLSEHVI